MTQNPTRLPKVKRQRLTWSVLTCSAAPDVSVPRETASPAVPGTVRAAAAILAAYGVVVLINALIEQRAIGWSDIEPRGLPRAVVRFVGMVLIAWGLLRGARWAWWLGVLFPGFLVLVGGVSIVAYLAIFDPAARELISPNTRMLVVVAFVALGTAVALLLTRSARAAFRPRG
jgi:hypothetical protein